MFCICILQQIKRRLLNNARYSDTMYKIHCGRHACGQKRNYILKQHNPWAFGGRVHKVIMAKISQVITHNCYRIYTHFLTAQLPDPQKHNGNCTQLTMANQLFLHKQLNISTLIFYLVIATAYIKTYMYNPENILVLLIQKICK